jgi:hypothetical protein
MLHALAYPFSGSDIVSDLIYVAYLAFMWGTLGLASFIDLQGSIRPRRPSLLAPEPAFASRG